MLTLCEYYKEESSITKHCLVGVASQVSEILLLSKKTNFPFPTMDYNPWSSKNLIDQNRLKKFMHVDIDVTCMYTDFGGHASSGF